jgi:hypothetical protein
MKLQHNFFIIIYKLTAMLLLAKTISGTTEKLTWTSEHILDY